MVIYTVTTSYFNGNLFGTYSTMKRARLAIEHFFEEDNNITTWEDTGDYGYQFETADGTLYGIEILASPLDEEFVEGLIEEGE